MALPNPDFLHPLRGPSRLAWLAMLTALAVLAVAAGDAFEARSERDRARALAARAPAAPAARAPAPETTSQRALRQALARLDRPWADVFASIESVPGGSIAWLALEVSESGTLRLEGEAADTAHVLAAADALRADALWREVLVARLDAGAPGGRQRFAIVASPAEGAW